MEGLAPGGKAGHPKLKPSRSAYQQGRQGKANAVLVFSWSKVGAGSKSQEEDQLAVSENELRF